MSRSAYTAIVLRYVHDLVSEEFVNVGILLTCPEFNYVKFAALTRVRRVLDFFPGSDARTIRAALNVATRNAQVFNGLFSDLMVTHQSSEAILKAAHRIVPHDDSGLQWSHITTGLTHDPAKTFGRLYDRLLIKYEDLQPKARRSDEQVWSSFSRALEKRNVSALIREHVVSSRLESLTFKHALKNGKWHLLEPVSFDLASAESIKDKAKKLLGEMTLLKDNGGDFCLYFLVGQPNNQEVADAYSQALKILQEVPLQKEIYTEAEAEKFATRLAAVASTH
ncbi:DUF3037 domain-containing protein [Xanthomonas arboricola]|uniref:DUF3037 domain-containing protein n=1 Tax=Xanthomonas arboricola TaxID=56448 RepID=UPI0015CB0D8B